MKRRVIGYKIGDQVHHPADVTIIRECHKETSMPEPVYRRCRDAGLPDADALRVYEAVKAFDSDDVRMAAVDALIRAWKSDHS